MRLFDKNLDKADYQLPPLQDSAGRLASERGLTDMERNGLGVQWQHDFVRKALLANYKPTEMMENAGSGMVAGGMENSGAYKAKLPGMIAAAGYGIQAEAFGQAKGASDDASDRAFSQLLQLKGQQDALAFQRSAAQAQLDLQVDSTQKSWWDYAMEAGSFAGSVSRLS